jgi:hypothetical protein
MPSRKPNCWKEHWRLVPCILHLEKFQKMLFLEGYDSKTMVTEQAKLLKDLENIVNTQVLGRPDRKANWGVAIHKTRIAVRS